MVKVLISLSVLAAAATAGSVTKLPESVTKLIDYSINPCDDFYQYACGAWYKDVVIPPGRYLIDTAFYEIGIRNQAVLKKIYSDNKPKLGEFYNSCLDTATLSSLGVTPLEDSFKAIRSANTTLDLLIVAGELAKNGIPAFVDIKASADDNDVTKNALFGFRTPLSLDRRYYTTPSWETVEAEYKVYIASVLQLAGYTAEQAAAAVPVIIRFEQTLAGVALNELEEIGAPVSPYTAFTYSQLDQKYPLLIGSWLKAHGFDIYDQWDEVLSADAAKTADELAKALESSFSTGIVTADWLDNSTRANAQTKMSKLVHALGGPEKPQLYPTLTLDSKTYLNNRWMVSQVNVDTNLKLNGQPVDRRKFRNPPHVVNAYYGPQTNQITLPASILQKPFFDGQFDAAQNFGGIGAVIGHEITHGFDNNGRQYDSDGNLKQWWSNATSTAFNTKSQCIIDQYANFVVKSEVNGAVLGNISAEISLDENIADNGGLKTSFRAYHEYLKKFPSQYTEEAGDKLFYLSYAQSWCSKSTDASLKMTLRGKHPPNRFRVTGALQNDAEFARVFQCPTDSYLNPSNKCLLWE
ncbi:hypothetical protein H257_18706 [Aphanomyces astaci]|uniref:Peptidase M13 C-terminal domain-containing protein n=1 Tax=Aphanomyces astaci TaxID=112090 RepID=W4FAA5_APHAT|nr:hypothetical protein H257_18706 [Aphanomyces astaci]ETV64392.1 hypothetical protein H257_18706 [Aphanomyces astaci]|eukprot:XP_009846125.1 hypothetical protein H257_18706 [Aphanomyces astaci]